MLGLGLLSALFAVWFNRSKTYRTLQRLGPTNCVLIAHAPQVEFLRLLPAAKQDKGEQPMLVIGGHSFLVEGSWDISKSPGLSHLRHALRQDASYEWERDPQLPHDWQFGLQFTEDHETVLMVFQLSDRAAWVDPSSAPLTLGNTLSQGLNVYFQEILKNRAERPTDSPATVDHLPDP